MNIRKIIKDRFDRWTKHLRRHQATPMVTIGIAHRENNKGQLIICTTEGTTDEEVAIFLTGALNQIQNHMAQQN